MTPLEELMDVMRDNARRTFVDARTEGARIPNLVTVLTPDLPRAMRLVPFMVFADTDRTIEVAKMAICGLNASIVVIVSDTWHARRENNPDTGQPWVTGEMSTYVEAHGPGDVVTEAALITGHTREGDSTAICLPYEIKADGLWWGKEVALDQPRGIVPAEIDRAFALPTFTSVHPGEPADECAIVALKAIAESDDVMLAEVLYF